MHATPHGARAGWLTLTLAILAVAALGEVSSSALAATTVGQLATPDSSPCGGPATLIQTAVGSGASYTVPAAGVITSWSVNDGPQPLVGLKLKVVTPLPDGLNYTLAGESDAGAQVPSAINTYSARIPVRPGDDLGIFEGQGDCNASVAPGDFVFVGAFDMPLGTTSPLISLEGIRLPITALVEPDADADGFGDETQDQCPGDASAHGLCPAPVTPPVVTPPALDVTAPAITVSAAATRLSTLGSIAFFVTSSEAATGTAGASVKLPTKPRVVLFASRKLSLGGGVRTKVSLKLSKAAAGRVRSLLKRGKRPVVTATVSLQDAAGNATTMKLDVKLKR
jgi:hypothetical protein